MVSRPIVAAPLAGLLVGDPASAMGAGVLLELISLRQLPVGANRHWDTGPAGVAAGTVAGIPGAGVVGLLIGVGLGAFIGWLGGWTVHGLRHINARVAANLEQRPLSPAALDLRHLSAMSIDLCRGTALTLFALTGIALLSSWLGDSSGGWSQVAALLLATGVSLSVGVAVGTLARGRSVWIALAVGALLSALIVPWQ